MENLKIVKLRQDIEEINNVLDLSQFNRENAENIISKHNLTNAKIALYNSKINSDWVSFEDATNQQMINNLSFIKSVLEAELFDELQKGEK